MKPFEEFLQEKQQRVKAFEQDKELQALSKNWLQASMARKYVYNFSWMDRPIIQYPQDILAVQELVWEVKPDLIIETGIAHGGSLILSASLLALLDMSDAIQEGVTINPRKSQRMVLGVDIDIRQHNRVAIEEHPMGSRIKMLQGSSVDHEIVKQVADIASGYERVLVFLDSMHTHDHVLAELESYAPLVTRGSYCVVFDTFVEDMPPGFFADRPWDVGNNPKTAVREYLENHDEFVIDKELENKLLITVAPDGYLKRIK